MEFSNTNALLIQAVYHSQKGEEGVSLVNLIGYVDYVNHSIITYQELTESINSAKVCGLIEIQKGKLKTTNSFKSWRVSLPKKLNFRKENSELLSYLDKCCRKLGEAISTPEFSAEEFNSAVEEYLKKTR